MTKHTICFLSHFLLAAITALAADHLVINEIHYHPEDDGPTEFIELYNPTASSIDVNGYAFTAGVEYRFNKPYSIPPDGYLLVVKHPDYTGWRGKSIVGPYAGKLTNSGESLVLHGPDGDIVDQVDYRDDPPWPRGPDGYGSSLERISADHPSDDYHNWRTSLTKGGTPGEQNSVHDVPWKPTILSYRIEPEHPTSLDAVDLEIVLDGEERIGSVTLQIETLSVTGQRHSFSTPMAQTVSRRDYAAFEAGIPAQDSQTLVRFRLDVDLDDGQTLALPHHVEPRPFESYFVYDDEIPSELPVLWLFPTERTTVTAQSVYISGVVVKPMGERPVEVYDGARIIDSRNGNKLRFIKGEEYDGNRTLNLIPESPPRGTTAGAQSPHVEQLSLDIFRDFGVLSPKARWHRVVSRRNGRAYHEQRITIQQPNEQFLRLNDRNADGNVYKIAYNEPGGYTKKTNIDEGDQDYRELFQHVNINNHTDLSEALRRFLVIEEVMGYEVAVNLMSHWDGIKNNIFLYHHPPPIDKWEIIPWDVDKTFGYLDSDPMYWKMPIDFPLTGYAPGPENGAHELNGRNLVGPIGRPFHMDDELHEEYVGRVVEALDGLFSEERVGGMIDDIETLLLEDLDLLETYIGSTRTSRRNQIHESYDTMRKFLRLRHQYLRSNMPTRFDVSRDLGNDEYKAASTIEGVKLTVDPGEDNSISAVVKEQIPEGFSVENIQVTEGTSVLIARQIVWQFSDLSVPAELTYDLIAPASDPPFRAEITGTITVNQQEHVIENSTLFLMSGLNPEWVIGTGGIWSVADGVLSCYADTRDDPKHAWVDMDLGTGDYAVKADLRMVDWENTDYARAGVAVRVNPDDGERALNALVHNDTNSFDLLNDLVSWGTRGDYAWNVGQWYSISLTAEGSRLTGSIKARGSAEEAFTITWDDPRAEERSPGYPGLTASSLEGLTAQFDNFEVLVDGRVVFSDDFDDSVGVPSWELY